MRQVEDNAGKQIVVFDLFGTLTDTRHREHFIRTKDWDSFFNLAERDTPIANRIELLKAHVKNGETVEVWTTHPDSLRDVTLAWMSMHLGVIADGNQNRPVWLEVALRMKEPHKFATEPNVKKGWLRKVRDAGGSVLLAYEERAAPREMFASEGVHTPALD